MLEVTPEAFLEALSEAVARQNLKQMNSLITLFASFCFKESSSIETFSEEVFERLIALMEEEKFRSLKETHEFLMLFEYDWGRLTGSQKDRLLLALETGYGKYADWMSDFVTSELLGEYYCDKAAFSVLMRLQSTSNEGARALVAHGFEHIAKGASEQALRAEALSRLQAMLSDTSNVVRSEAETALAKLKTS